MKKSFYQLLITLSFSFLPQFLSANNDIAALSAQLEQLSGQLQQMNTELKQLPQAPTVPVTTPVPTHTFAYQTFDEWKTACDKLPFLRKEGINFDNKPEKLTFTEIQQTLNLFSNTLKLSALSNPTYWVDGIIPSPAFFEETQFQPYAEKLVVPIGSQVALHGDLHGDVHSLVTYLQDLKERSYLDDTFKITKDNFYIVFLGDYVDRGNYGIEVIYTLMRLKIANPEKVVMVRGNHEELEMISRWGFEKELTTKFKDEDTSTIHKLYNLLPVVLYLGSGNEETINFIQCCHGGLELGYLPTQLLALNQNIGFEWIKELNRELNFRGLQLSLNHSDFLDEFNFDNDDKIQNFTPETSFDLGFLWNDFSVKIQHIPIEDLKYNSSRGFIFGPLTTKAILKASSSSNKNLVGIFRAHQHSFTKNDMMKCILDAPDQGICKLWKKPETTSSLWPDIVITFNVSPDSSYGKALQFTYDTYGVLTTGTRFPEDWQLEIIRIEVIELET